MKLKTILNGIAIRQFSGDPEVEISSVVTNSQAVTPGALFIALRGSRHDGHHFIDEAVAKGASAVMVEEPVSVAAGVCVVQVEDTQSAQTIVGKNFYGDPAAKLKLIGITGTKGKTTTAFMIASILQAAGFKVGLIGTNYYLVNGEKLPSVNTTPASLELHRLFAEMVKGQTEYVVMEVSSHAIALGRIAGLEFYRGVFTNITRDHLDFHQTFEEYLKVKTKFIADLSPLTAKAIINVDDPYGPQIAAATAADVITYGLSSDARVRAENIKMTMRETSFDLVSPEGCFPLRLNLIGRFNVYNALAASSLGLSLGLNGEVIRSGLARLEGVSGRFELVPTPGDYTVVIDYAHTPDSLKNLLQTARALVKNRLITVFGCGGNRDQGKRPLMGGIAAELSDYTIITNDNPRWEDPAAIAEQIKAGFLEKKPDGNVTVLLDRGEAIRQAVMMAETGDMVVIAGKGHETYQDFGSYKIHFDDKEAVLAAAKEKAEA
ncbi:MAG TPA: UDP-N-acetylmuramoyl-L-alanyl-D-glutamate--2,6-diaminopimelate ligase [Firmicutes bacterium]|uniref:UDP-N-acetylmuramoyl-L-alanyl-D-glutamate--2,6-diaminopimelate ligase n=1 Tax=Capillibacterium thermochitinicola TaxID=2699427 RepID=A0A8J6I281_9FIRM|nr:UDP-N-acetylmuramoyl-L-alanyl-D-glutamate--2,6-diaminopimelate ligase [Capillibacterium thermochitinicola]MBA2133628.1 UDP-N-acetylmuramoyl-L-alanyl-D-glutamate--2,6-diaminopimelate ligase [Capillibacterium thermochitinicola]HHW11734.1 UDP-N-acetylmuramoyl-L-alanyl-D-glutamate--2,6-diaminopimelate ligase [Bacillota bacterium]